MTIANVIARRQSTAKEFHRGEDSPGVGPRYPQVVVLVGATGDLSQRKLLPGLFHLGSAGFIPGCRIIGVSLDDIDADGFRDDRARGARRVLDAQGRRRPTGPPLRRSWTTCRWPRAPARSRRRSTRRSRRFGGESRRAALPERAAERRAVGGAAARRGRPRRALAHHHGKAVRHRPGERRVAERQAARGVRRGPDLPHRPFPRQGAGAEHPRVPLRQRPVRADLEPQLHRPRADRRAGDAGARQARRVLRADRRVSRHGGDAPVPDPRVHGDGAADRAGAGADQRGEEQGLSQHAADRAERRRARAIHRLSRRGRASTRSRTPRPSSR